MFPKFIFQADQCCLESCLNFLGMPIEESVDQCPTIQFQVASLVARQAYSLLLDALRCKGVSADSKLSTMLAEIRKILSISQENHYCELRRVLNDDKMTEIGNIHNKNESNDFEESWRTLLPNDRLEVSNILSSDLHCRRLADQFSMLINRHNRNLKRTKVEPISANEILTKKQRKAFEHYTQATSDSSVHEDEFKNVEKLIVPPCLVEPELTLSASSIIEAPAPQISVVRLTSMLVGSAAVVGESSSVDAQPELESDSVPRE